MHSLNLRQQQKVADEMNIIKKKNKKGTSYKSTSKIKRLLNEFNDDLKQNYFEFFFSF